TAHMPASANRCSSRSATVPARDPTRSSSSTGTPSSVSVYSGVAVEFGELRSVTPGASGDTRNNSTPSDALAGTMTRVDSAANATAVLHPSRRHWPADSVTVVVGFVVQGTDGSC